MSRNVRVDWVKSGPAGWQEGRDGQRGGVEVGGSTGRMYFIMNDGD